MARKDVSDYLVCRACLEQRRCQPAWEWLMEQTGQPWKVCWRALERTYEKGYIEYGTSLNFPWLSEKGKELLSANPL